MSRPLKTILTEMLKAEGVAPVALELGKSAGWVSQITHGNTIPSDEVLVKLAKKYAKSDEILGELLHAAAFARLSSQKFDEPVLEITAGCANAKISPNGAKGNPGKLSGCVLPSCGRERR
jgi:transcriptional regulator with XRE-family HTH domain